MAQMVKAQAAQHHSIADHHRDALLPLAIQLLNMKTRYVDTHSDSHTTRPRNMMRHNATPPPPKRLRVGAKRLQDVCQDFFFFAMCLLGNGFGFASKLEWCCVATVFGLSGVVGQRVSCAVICVRNALLYMAFGARIALRYNGFRA